jgi:hypothetical protein
VRAPLSCLTPNPKSRINAERYPLNCLTPSPKVPLTRRELHPAHMCLNPNPKVPLTSRELHPAHTCASPPTLKWPSPANNCDLASFAKPPILKRRSHAGRYPLHCIRTITITHFQPADQVCNCVAKPFHPKVPVIKAESVKVPFT